MTKDFCFTMAHSYQQDLLDAIQMAEQGML